MQIERGPRRGHGEQVFGFKAKLFALQQDCVKITT